MEIFDFNKINDFDKHINLSIPNYDFLKDHVKFLIEALSDDNTNILDLGCSTGSLLLSVDRKENCEYIGYDNSNLIPTKNHKNLRFVKEDLINAEFPKNSSIIVSMFTLQFLPVNKRESVMKKIYNSLNKGGYAIICEKIHSTSPNMEQITNNIYYKYKRKYFSDTEILEKQQMLTGVMRLRTIPEIEEELSVFSFKEIFWKSYGFCGFVVKK